MRTLPRLRSATVCCAAASLSAADLRRGAGGTPSSFYLGDVFSSSQPKPMPVRPLGWTAESRTSRGWIES